VQEALANVYQHSGSSTATITLFRDPASVTLEIADRGCGFRIDTAGARLGVGVAGMRERVRQLRGEFDIQGGNGGTVVRVVLPLGAAGASDARRGEHDLDVAV
jgi:two-component system sensor histidine kinase UhpB